jgi:hypothetical protein
MTVIYNERPTESKVNGNAAGAPAAVIITVSPARTASGRPLSGRFDARVGDQVIVTASRQPFLGGARALLEAGFDSDQIVVMRHAGSATDCLTSTVGVAAKLTVKEPDNGVAHFAAWKAFCASPVDAPAAPDGLGAIGDRVEVGIAVLMQQAGQTELAARWPDSRGRP